MAAYYYDKFARWTDSSGEPEKGKHEQGGRHE
jgi:hypothetical protein